MTIKVLDQKTQHLMQSAVQIQSPITVIKELMDNAIDAQARNISLNIINNGLTTISVQDDGIGIDIEGLQLLGIQQATSKPQDQSQQGFRGEALFVINAVSSLIIKSRTRNNSLGNELNLKTGQLNHCGCEYGTQVVCNNLFNTLPIRREYFQKQNQTLTKQIHKFLFHYQLAFRKIKIKAIVNGSVVFNIQDEQCDNFDLKHVYTSIFLDQSPQEVEKFINFEKSTPDITIECFLSAASGGIDKLIPVKNIYIIINGRPCLCPAIITGLTAAFQKFSAMRHPVGCIEITLAKGEVDFNISADKLDVKLRYQNKVCQFIQNTYEEELRAQTVVRLSSKLDKSVQQPMSAKQRYEVISKKLSSRLGATTSQVSQMRSNLMAVLNKNDQGGRGNNIIYPAGQREKQTNSNDIIQSPVNNNDYVQTVSYQSESSTTITLDDENNLNSVQSIDSSQSSQIQRAISPEFDKLTLLTQNQQQQQQQTDMQQNTINDSVVSNNLQAISSDVQSSIELLEQVLLESTPDPLEQLNKLITQYHSNNDFESASDTQKSDEDYQVYQETQSTLTLMTNSSKENSNNSIADSQDKQISVQNTQFMIQDQKIQDTILKAFIPLRQSQSAPNPFSELQLIGQYNNSFIIVTNFNQQSFLLDQHSLEESIIYNKLLTKMQQGGLIQTQKLLQPEQLKLSIDEASMLAHIGDLSVFNGYGFNIIKNLTQASLNDDQQQVSGQNYYLTSRGYIDRQLLTQDDLKEILSQLCEGIEVPVPHKIHRILANRACKSAVKLGDQMTRTEMNKLLKQAAYDGRCFNCPHGRPSIQLLFQ